MCQIRELEAKYYEQNPDELTAEEQKLMQIIEQSKNRKYDQFEPKNFDPAPIPVYDPDAMEDSDMVRNEDFNKKAKSGNIDIPDEKNFVKVNRIKLARGWIDDITIDLTVMKDGDSLEDALCEERLEKGYD